MTDPTQAEQQYLHAVHEGQQAIVDAVEAWSKGVERLALSYPPVPGAPEHPTAQEVVENAFDFAEKLLAAQAGVHPPQPPRGGRTAAAPTACY